MKKQNKKNKIVEFFKPRKWKIVLTVVLAIIIPLLAYFGNIVASIVYNLYFLPFILSNYFVLEIKGGFDTVYQPTLLSMVIFILVYLVEVYLISCIIIGIYNMSKKGKMLEKKNKKKTLLMVTPIMLLLLVSTISAVSQTINVNIVETKKLDLTFIPIDNISESIFDSNVEEFITFFNKTYPMAEDDLIINIGSAYSTSDKEKSSAGRLLFNIAKKFSILPDRRIRVVGVLPEDWFNDFQNESGMRGIAYRPPMGAFIRSSLVEAVGIRQIPAHEIGHTLGFCDEYNASYWSIQDSFPFYCPNGDTDDDNELDSNCKPNGCPTSTIGKLVPWNDSNDFIDMTNFMGVNNQDEAWISKESYIHLLDKFQKSSPPAVQNGIVVNGKINKTDNTIELFTSYIINNVEITTQEENTTGNYSIEIMDENNVTTSEINFTPSFLEIGFNGSTVEINVSYFIMIMNFSSTDKIVRAKENNITKDEVNRTTHSPSLEITTNLSGQNFSGESFNVTWNSTDADGDSIVFALLFSEDNGSNYTTLEIDYNQTNITLDSSNLLDCNYCRIKILATDGINTNSSVSDSFSINIPPNITEIITINESGIVGGEVVMKDNVTFNVTVTDNSNVESVWLKIWEGVVGSSSVIWQGFLNLISGNSWSVTLETNESFPVGKVNYTVYANDSSGNEVNVSGNFTIILPNDTYKFYIKNNLSEPVAWLGSEGNIVLEGTCSNQTTCTAPADSFIIANNADNTTAYIDNQGNLCVEKGDCSDQSASCNPTRDAFIIRNASGSNMSYIDFDGDLCLIGGLYENADL
jgi:hypothetical protein